MEAEVDFNPYYAGTIQTLVDAWLPLSFALNNLNRSMGVADAYPFFLSTSVIAKLGFIHELIHGSVPEEKSSSQPQTPALVKSTPAPSAAE